MVSLVHPTTSAPEVEEEILHRLVALNAEWALEERRGLIRWLRLDFQDRSAGVPAGGRGVCDPSSGRDARTPSDACAPWPKTLPEQIQALRSALAAHPGPASAADLAQDFTRAPRAKLAELLETLASLGLARRLDDGRYLPGRSPGRNGEGHLLTPLGLVSSEPDPTVASRHAPQLLRSPCHTKPPGT